jgi:hypothetical protein
MFLISNRSAVQRLFTNSERIVKEDDIETRHSLSQPTTDDADQLGEIKMSFPHVLFQVRIVCGQD